MITSGGYRYINLPPYTPELIRLKQFWYLVKDRVRRSKFGDAEDLHTRIAEPGNMIPPEKLKNITQHSVKCFDKYLRKEPV